MEPGRPCSPPRPGGVNPQGDSYSQSPRSARLHTKAASTAETPTQHVRIPKSMTAHATLAIGIIDAGFVSTLILARASVSKASLARVSKRILMHAKQLNDQTPDNSALEFKQFDVGQFDTTNRAVCKKPNTGITFALQIAETVQWYKHMLGIRSECRPPVGM